MSFESGGMSYQRYFVIGDSPATPDEDTLGKLAAHVLRPLDIGVPEDVEWGWAGPRHVLDQQFNFEGCVFNDCVHFAIRIDTNTVPGSLKTAWQKSAEAAAAEKNPSGFISKAQKRQVKEDVGRMVDAELRSGKYRRSKHVPLLWDMEKRLLYGPASVSVREKVQELFSRTFELELQPLTSGNIGLRELNNLAKRREYEDLTPTRFAKSLEDPDMAAEYPWTAKGDGAKDFLGNEFMLWLWHRTQKSGVIDTTVGDVTLMIDRSLSLDCAFGQSGKDAFTATGPARMPEAFDALRTGKVPRRAGLILDCKAGQYNVTLAGDAMTFSSLLLPEVEKADTARTLFEERITLMRSFHETIDAMFYSFLRERIYTWPATVESIRRWMAIARPLTSQVAEVVRG